MRCNECAGSYDGGNDDGAAAHVHIALRSHSLASDRILRMYSIFTL